jgi:hypothetical protein
VYGRHIVLVFFSDEVSSQSTGGFRKYAQAPCMLFMSLFQRANVKTGITLQQTRLIIKKYLKKKRSNSGIIHGPTIWHRAHLYFVLVSANPFTSIHTHTKLFQHCKYFNPYSLHVEVYKSYNKSNPTEKFRIARLHI